LLGVRFWPKADGGVAAYSGSKFGFVSAEGPKVFCELDYIQNFCRIVSPFNLGMPSPPIVDRT
jgi:hypothetical protein